jgi:hypothetical protein
MWLARHIAGLRAANPGWEYPDCDPLGGGVNAEILFVFEKPGPKTSEAGGGSGFLSVDNNDGTAANTCAFLEKARIAREKLLFWNAMPGWNGKIAYTAEEIKKGSAAFRDLLTRFPKLRFVVLVGKAAEGVAGPVLAEARPDVQVLVSAYPSPQVYRFNPAKWHAIPAAWAAAA